MDHRRVRGLCFICSEAAGCRASQSFLSSGNSWIGHPTNMCNSWVRCFPNPDLYPLGIPSTSIITFFFQQAQPQNSKSSIFQSFQSQLKSKDEKSAFQILVCCYDNTAQIQSSLQLLQAQASEHFQSFDRVSTLVRHTCHKAKEVSFL